MDRLKKSRKPLRSQVTRVVNESNAQFDVEEPDKDVLLTNLTLLQNLMEDLKDLDEKVKEKQLDEDATDEEMEVEFEAVQRYQKLYIDVKRRIEKFLNPRASPAASEILESAGSDDGRSVASVNTKRRVFQLPTISLKPFDGTLKSWLSWWSQFSKIHDDDDIDASDKFQYLSQAILEGTEAKELVNSYPHSADNYPRVVEALIERYGRDDLQLQFYVRELLTLVISNVTKRDKLPLSSLFLKLESHLRCLTTLKLDQADPATWLFPLVESSLSEETLRAWQRSSFSKQDGTMLAPQQTRLDLLMEFVKGEVRTEQQIALAQSTFHSATLEENSGKQPGKGKQNSSKKQQSEEVATAAGLISGVVSCAFCEGKHDSDRCVKAQSMPFAEKREKLQSKKLCFKCLRPGHITNKCKCTVRCIICGGRHYAIMCQEQRQKDSKEVSQHEGPPATTYSHRSKTFTDGQGFTTPSSLPESHKQQWGDYPKSSSNSNQCSNDVLLNTILVKLKGRNSTMMVRLVGDTGSQRSYVRSDVIRRLGCEQVGQEWIQNVLFGGITTPPILCKKYAVSFIDPADGKEEKFHLLEKKEICGQLSKIPNGPWISELRQQGIALSDVGSGCGDIDVLLGSDYWGNVLTGKISKLKSGLVAVETIFGWTLSGRIPSASSNYAVAVSSMFVSSSSDISNLWSLEALGIRDPIEKKTLEEEEMEAVSHFNSTVSQNEDGGYVVSLPWKCEQVNLPSNRHIAERRLVRATSQLKKQNKFQEYDDVFRLWEKEAFITEDADDSGEGHFLPHRPVFKEGSSTPVRPVYDASCKSKNGPSINDVLYTGPNLLELIPTLLIRFREKKIGVSADIRKAFQMVRVKEEDQKFQRFLWWETSSCEKLKVYQHHRVVFGMTCSPFLLASTINHHLSTQENHEFAEKLRTSFYVDNCVLSVSSYAEYEQFRSEAVRVMEEAKMELRQWAFTIPEDEHCGFPDSPVMEDSLSLLGVFWDRREDVLFVDVPEIDMEETVTKRKILSFVARIFDPIGFTAPAILPLKLLLQESVALKCGWDDILPQDLKKKFQAWGRAAAFFQDVKIPRHFQLPLSSSREIHIFVDGSSYAYAGVVLMRTSYHGEVKVQLLLAKSRLAPTTTKSRKASIPRLELMACLLGVRLSNTVKDALDWDSSHFRFWSDSTTALAWIRRRDQWGTFVGNRVAEIVKTTDPVQWKHVPGIQNPADLPSRGCNPLQLLQSRWWEGPNWLLNDPSTWPNAEELVDEEAVNSEKKKSATIVATQVFPEPRFSNFRKNVAVWAWVLRFIKCGRTKKPQRSALQKTHLDLAEMREAEVILLCKIQEECFPNPNKRIGGMMVKVDEKSLLRVETRLLNRDDKADFLHPILLPKSHPLVNMLILDLHRYFGHAGTQFLISKLREKYWILQTRRTIQRVLRTCAICRRYQSKPCEVVPAPLPPLRVSNSEPFQTTGVDLAGPVVLRDGSKAWIVLFTCAYYRCLHLDVVTSTSTEAFIGSLERFMSIYGRPNTIYSDNGTNFHGAANLFRRLNWKRIEFESNARQIQWIFNPPSASWYGGWWERLVRSVKDLLKRMLGNARLTYDEFRTCLCGVCATINERPLTVVTEDGEDLIPLTPSMFLRPRVGGIMPECATSRSLQEGYRRMKGIQMQLQDRFRKEYLSLLVQRGNAQKKKPPKLGDVVLVGAENRKRFQWPLGVIVELMPGRDGECRVAKVKTSRGVLVRPLQRLYPLEVEGGMEVATRLKSAIPPEQLKSPEVKVPSVRSVRETTTKSGRIAKRPVRYGQYFNF